MERVCCNVCNADMEMEAKNSWVCPNCRNRAYNDGLGGVYFEHDPEDDYDEYYGEDIPEGCAACGGDYPNCASSCPLMSD